VIDPRRLLDLEFPEIRHTFTRRDTVLYALGVGIGCDPLDPEQLRFVYERNLVALPTMATTLTYPGDWYLDFDTRLDHQQVVHASESITIHTALPVEGTVFARPRVLDVIDKGKGKGALVVSERIIYDASGQELATVRQTAMRRSDGGFSPTPQKSEPQTRPPNRAPDFALRLTTTPQAARVYRLSGDPNPLHADPEFARGPVSRAPSCKGSRPRASSVTQPFVCCSGGRPRTWRGWIVASPRQSIQVKGLKANSGVSRTNGYSGRRSTTALSHWGGR
jgi:MaoC like domain/N-terminal half of MaoC dehydratase